MKKCLPFILGIIAFICIGPSANAQTVELNFNITDAQIVNSKLSGFNTGPTFNEMFEASNSPVSIVDACAILPPPFDTFNDFKIVSFTPQENLVQKTADIKPTSMRFPGGTIANFYHLYEYEDGTYDPDAPIFAAGCGTQDVETSVFGGANVIREQFCKKDPRVILDDAAANPNYIRGFVNYVLAVEEEVHATGDTDYKMDVIYVPNVFAHFQTKFLVTVLKEAYLEPSDPSDHLNIADPTAIFELYYKEVIDALDYLIDNDINVVGIEFGNELFFPFYQTSNSNVTPETYMALSDIYSKRIAAEYPEMKFAVLSEPSNATWNNAVKAYTPEFYDAVALHDYYTNNACISEGEPCPDGCPDDYVTDRTCRFDCGKCALGDYTRHELKPEFSHALDGFPTDTKLWLTEWGIISPGVHTGNNLDYMNTFLYASFIQEHLMQQIEFNVTNNNTIEFSTHHRIGYKNRWSVIQTRLGVDTSAIQSNFYTYQFFEPLAQASEAYSYQGIDIPILLDSNTVTVNSFLIQNDAEINPQILIYYSNKTTNSLPLDVADFTSTLFEGSTYTINELASSSYLQAADSTGLYSSFGETKFNDTWHDNTENPSLTIVEELSVDLSSYEIPALSTGLITIDLEKVIGIMGNSNEAGFQLYPNPGNGDIQLIIPTNTQAKSIQIRSITGDLIYTFSGIEKSDYTFNTSELETGIYLVKIIHEQGESTLKFIKR
ncbi:MAG: T9SS type A sorting domain-containing protein [Crocinitomix sp.]|nr:T9SS type A sorting domain-containing protein [Crocinitomix sp.]